MQTVTKVHSDTCTCPEDSTDMYCFSSFPDEETGEMPSNENSPNKQDEALNTRNADGTFKKGHSGNMNGRPKKNESIVERFRNNDNCQSIINKLFAVANTLDDAEPHKDALASAKLIVERLIPSLKASELKVSDGDEKGYVLLPNPEEDE